MTDGYVDRGAVVAHLRPVELARRQPPASITAAALQHKRFKPVGWVVNDFIPDGLTILAGKPKLGKSWLVLDVANAVARGGFTMGDRKCVEGDVLYAALEDNERRLKGRMAKVCALDGAWPDRLTFWTGMNRLEDGGLQELRDWIASVPGPRLVIIDTFAKVRSTKGRDEGVYEADYRAAAPLKALADETGVAVVIVHHLRKQAADDDPLDAVSGSTGLTGAADTILVLNRGSEGVTLYGRGRDIEEIESAVQFERDVCRWRVLGEAKEVRTSTERQAILDALKAAGVPMTPVELSDVTGHVRVSTRRLLFSMAKAGEVCRLGRGKYHLPDFTPPNIGNTRTREG